MEELYLEDLRLPDNEDANDARFDMLAQSIRSLGALKELNLDGGRENLGMLLDRLGVIGLPHLHKLCLFPGFPADSVRNFLRLAIDLAELEVVALHNDDVNTVLTGLHMHPSIRELRVTSAGIPATSAILLLHNNHRLQKLSFVNCDSISQFCALLDVLSTNNPTLLDLAVSLGNATDNFDEEPWTGGQEELSRSLSRVGNLQRLEMDFDWGCMQDLVLPGLVRGFENNFSLTDVYIDGIEDEDETEEAMMKIAYYTTRNKVPTLRNPQTAMAIVTGIIPSLLVNCPEPESGLTVVYETLLNRAAADWNSDYGTQTN